MVRRNVTGANYGVFSWLLQRITAIIMLVSLVFICGVILNVALNVTSDIISWQNAFHCVFVQVVVQLFFAALLFHAWVGMRDLWMDYISHHGIKLTLHVFTIIWLIASFMYSIKVIWI